jgi:SPX domain protein involved in polyphosphate accumulation
MKFEFKYIVPVSKMDALREAFSPFVELDPYAASAANHQYKVRSIYFDTPRFDFYFEKLDGFKVRKKIRIRGYNEKIGDDIVFLEIKRKFKEPIEKSREKLTFDFVRQLLNSSDINYDQENDHWKSDDINGAGKFFYHVYSQRLKPVILVIYEREAYFDRFGQDVRLTIDKNLRCLPYPGIDDLFREDKASYAMKDHFIFEVKFRENFPFWLRPVIGRLGLMKQAASKYVMCINTHKLIERMQYRGGRITLNKNA